MTTIRTFFAGALAGLLLWLSAAPAVHAQSLLWQKSYRSGIAGENGNYYGGSVKLGPNLYAHAGSTSLPNGTYYAYFLFTNAQGDSVGTKVIAAPIGAAARMVSNRDGTFTWTGFIQPRGPRVAEQHALTKMDAQGQVLWQTSFHLPDATGRRTTANGNPPIIRTPDGYVVAANTLVYTMPTGTTSLPRQTLDKFDNQGQLVWERTVAGDANTAGLCLQPNGAYVTAGYVGVHTPLTPSGTFSLDWRLVEFTHRGDTLRTKRFGVAGDYDDATRLISTADQGVAVLTAYEPRVTTNPNPRVQRLVKLDSLWNVQWQVTLPQSSYFVDLRQTRTGEYLLAGGAGGATGTNQAQVYRYSATGLPLRNYGPYGLGTNTYGITLQHLLHEPGDSLMAWGSAFDYTTPAHAAYTQRFYGVGIGGTGAAAVGAPYAPDYCRYPPQAVLGWQPLSPTSPDSLVLVELSSAGPRYAQNALFRWTLGDGTVRETTQGGTFRYRYAQVPPPGTAVTLTVSNNLGCASTTTVYPFGRPTAAQQGRALAERAALWPNPAADAATLALAQAPPGPLAVALLDALGRVVLQPAAPPVAAGGTLALPLDLRGLPLGVYTVRVRTSAGSFTKRLVRY